MVISLTDILVPFFVFATIFGVIYVYFSTRNKERLALIDKGTDASLFDTKRKSNWKNFMLSSGMLLVGIGVGIMVGTLLTKSIPLEKGVAYPMSIFIFAGLSLIIYYFVDRKTGKTDKEE